MKLNKLIWSLSASEKRFFNFLNPKTRNNGTSKVFKLFNYIDHTNQPSKSDKSNQIDDLARTKYKLNQLLEQSLVFHSSGIFKLQPDTLDLLRLSIVFYQKNLYEQCLKTIYKGFVKAGEEEDFSTLFSLLEVLEKVTYRKPSVLNKAFKDQIKEINVERKKNLKKIERISDLKELYAEISTILLQKSVEINQKEPLERYKKVIIEKVNSIPSNFLSKKEQFIYLKVMQAYYLLQDDVKSCLKETRNSLDLIEQNLNRDYFLVEDYLITYQNLIVAHLDLEDFAPVDQLIIKLSRFKVSSKNKPLLKLHESIINISRIRYTYKKKEFTTVLALIAKLNLHHTSELIQANNVMEIKSMEIFSNFVLRQFPTADNLIRDYLTNIPKNYLEIDRAGVLIVNILVNWEMGIRELIPSLCDATRYYFKRIESYQESDRLILSWFKSTLSKKMSSTDFKLKLKTLKDNLDSSNLEYSSKFQQIYFSSWVESKLNDTNPVDLIRTKEV